MKLIHYLSGMCVLASLAAANAQVLTDFEGFTAPGTDGGIMFRDPSYSGTTASKVAGAPAPNTSIVLNTGIPAGNPNVGNNALKVSWNFVNTGGAPLWLRLTTDGATQPLSSPTIPLAAGLRLQFDIWSDHAMHVALGIRETETGAAFGANGGNSGTIEYLGGDSPSIWGIAVAANTWTTVSYEFLNPAVTPVFTLSGNGVLDPGADGKGVLESLGLAFDDTPANRTETLNVWVDNFVVVPEPSSVVLTVVGGLTLLVLRRRRLA